MNFFERLTDRFSKDISVDLGTANIRVLVRGSKELIIEPSVVAINQNNGKILSVGTEAREMIGRTPANIVAIQPLKDGVISDFNACEAIIYYFIEKARQKFEFTSQFFKPKVIIGVPSLVTEVEINALVDASKSAGAGKVYVVEEPIASAIGANLPIEEAKGNMIVDIGGGTTDIAIISLGGVVVDNTIRTAGDKMDNIIVNYIKNKYNLHVSSKMAEDIKKEIGGALVKNHELSKTIKGQDMISGLPKSLVITHAEIVEALKPIIEDIAASIKEAIEKCPPEIISDLINDGIFISGGGAMLHGIDKFLSTRLKIPVHIVKDPLFSVIRGLGKLSKDTSVLDRVQIKDFVLR